ncbi:MAG: T9SS type A sorting domain-containing protein, partial [Pedobacter sp.]|nr:T9SS type A sorting domain-containing protein [Chitinophagaceae bacterium]
NVTAAALRFDGANDYVNCGNSASYNLTGSLSIEAYINRSILNTDDCIVGKDNFAASTGYSFWVYQNNKLIFRLGNREYSSTSTISQNVWTHVAATFDAGRVSLYINGVLDATFSGVANPVSNLTGLYIGTPQDALGNSLFAFSGTIDEVRLWNRALPQAEIMNNMNCELPTGQTGLLSYYQFNQGANGADNSTVTTLTDASGNSNTGTLTNFALSGTTSNWVLPGGVATGTTCAVLSTSNFDFTSNVSVYPNPSSDVFSINSDAPATVIIYDLLGKTIKSLKIESGVSKLDLNGCANGIYLMKVTNDSNQTKTMKLIKQ